jgi:hypothetical protein
MAAAETALHFSPPPVMRDATRATPTRASPPPKDAERALGLHSEPPVRIQPFRRQPIDAGASLQAAIANDRRLHRLHLHSSTPPTKPPPKVYAGSNGAAGTERTSGGTHLDRELRSCVLKPSELLSAMLPSLSGSPAAHNAAMRPSKLLTGTHTM